VTDAARKEAEAGREAVVSGDKQLPSETRRRGAEDGCGRRRGAQTDMADCDEDLGIKQRLGVRLRLLLFASVPHGSHPLRGLQPGSSAGSPTHYPAENRQSPPRARRVAPAMHPVHTCIGQALEL
jgi:hypothetical protein